MAIRTELTLRLQNSPGALGRVCQLLGDAKVGIHALSLETGGTVRLVADNPLSAVGVLEGEHYTVQQRDVLFIQLSNGPGALHQITRMLATAGVNIDYTYGASLESQEMAGIVVGVEDAQRASMAAGI
jgi:hypothetical protein